MRFSCWRSAASDGVNGTLNRLKRMKVLHLQLIYSERPDPGGPMAPADWTMSINVEESGGAVHYFADLSQCA